MSNQPALVVVTPDQLADIVRSAVADVLAEQCDDAPALLDRNGIAKALGCSPSSINRLRHEGLPHVLLGDSPRYELAQCLAWLREHRASNVSPHSTADRKGDSQ